MQTAKTGRLLFAILAFAGIAGSTSASAANVQFTAQVDRAEIAADDSVSVKLSIVIDGSARVGEPEMSAPDFILVNQFQSQFTQGYYDNGNFGMRTTYAYTKVLRPKQPGRFKISGLKVLADGQTKTAPDIDIQVTAGGVATRPPPRYGGTGVGLRGTGKAGVGALPLFIRAEIDKDRAYKGEQIVVSYYAYWRTRIFNLQAEKFPVLTGFLREELDMPIVNNRIAAERVVLDGVPYDRALIVRYAAYPLQEGKLTLDALGLKYNYNSTRARSGRGDDDEDAIFGFFQQMTPQTGASRSDPVTITALPLPSEGRPTGFSGGVGDFSVSMAADKLQLKAGEAVTLTVKVEGRGNVASIAEPKPNWPSGIEVYDSKGVSKASRAGIGEKIFEIVLIPREAGKVTLPSVELSFFSPAKHAYVTKKTEPIELTVLEGAPGESRPSRSEKSNEMKDSRDAKAPVLKGLKPDSAEVTTDPATLGSMPVWRWLYWIGILMVTVLVLTVGFDQWRRLRSGGKTDPKKDVIAELNRLRDASRTDSAQLTRAYERMVELLVVALEERTGYSLRSLPRSEIRDRLREQALENTAPGSSTLSPELWSRVDSFLEFADLVRFAGGAAGTEDAARSRLTAQVDEAIALERAISKQV